MEFMVRSRRSSNHTQIQLGEGQFRLGINRDDVGRKDINSGPNYCQSSLDRKEERLCATMPQSKRAQEEPGIE